MSAKKVTIPPKKSPKKKEQWVNDGKSKSEGEIKRLTLDLPEALHKNIKLRAVNEGTTMACLLRSILEEHFR